MARTVRYLCTSLALLLSSFGIIASAFAQDSPAQTPAPSDTNTAAIAPRGVVEFDAGTAFGNTEAHLAYTGRLGIALGAHVQVSAEIGRFDNIVPKSLRDNLRDASATLSPTVGAAVVPTSTVASNYGLGTVRLSHDVSPRVGVFVDAGAGVAMVRPQFSATAGGVDVTGLVVPTLTQPLPQSQNALSVVAGGGFSVRTVGRTTVDAAYRFGRIATSQPINTNTLYGGWTMRW